ncbi:hypothetical protein [Paramaledivibacter caminithermalis]|jgi:hypothetical protein|uniref:Uncharacterized protein n=1 Tax=Paramaledivibacter caminithermalis (strain DSM 15212 / CIP 107654 / DViRD3) TaxID=1121301 RepID=A0A1M6U9W3_PARC5|nr:hypothetical protein [Paramaledivibacter caminithermalis]SHK65848.1 hypothetical protein SAMN02745912_03901 [Paramaledivibacter caminithermalis DSM 15212]
MNYIICGFVVLLGTIFLSFFIGGVIGYGANSVGLILAAIALLNMTIATCTYIIVDSMKKYRS